MWAEKSGWGLMCHCFTVDRYTDEDILGCFWEVAEVKGTKTWEQKKNLSMFFSHHWPPATSFHVLQVRLRTHGSHVSTWTMRARWAPLPRIPSLSWLSWVSCEDRLIKSIKSVVCPLSRHATATVYPRKSTYTPEQQRQHSRRHVRVLPWRYVILWSICFVVM